MADVLTEFQFVCRLNQKEFSLVTRALAGHELKEQDLILALDLNKRLLELRLSQCQAYTRQAARALEVAEDEAKKLLEGRR